MRSHYSVLLFTACAAASAHPGTLGMAWKTLSAEEQSQTHRGKTNFGVCLQNQPVPGHPHWQSHPLSPSCECLSCSLRNDTHKPSPCEFHPERQQEENGHSWSSHSLQCQLLNSRGIHPLVQQGKQITFLTEWPSSHPHSTKGLSKTPLKIYLQPSVLKLPLLEWQDWCCVGKRPFKAPFLKSLNEQACINKSPVWDWSAS